MKLDTTGIGGYDETGSVVSLWSSSSSGVALHFDPLPTRRLPRPVINKPRDDHGPDGFGHHGDDQPRPERDGSSHGDGLCGRHVENRRGFEPKGRKAPEYLLACQCAVVLVRHPIVTSNLPFEEGSAVLGSERLTGALLDRLTHCVHILPIEGESYRLAQSEVRHKRNPQTKGEHA